jgi:hypothetical protein
MILHVTDRCLADSTSKKKSWFDYPVFTCCFPPDAISCQLTSDLFLFDSDLTPNVNTETLSGRWFHGRAWNKNLRSCLGRRSCLSADTIVDHSQYFEVKDDEHCPVFRRRPSCRSTGLVLFAKFPWWSPLSGRKGSNLMGYIHPTSKNMRAPHASDPKCAYFETGKVASVLGSTCLCRCHVTKHTSLVWVLLTSKEPLHCFRFLVSLANQNAFVKKQTHPP